MKKTLKNAYNIDILLVTYIVLNTVYLFQVLFLSEFSLQNTFFFTVSMILSAAPILLAIVSVGLWFLIKKQEIRVKLIRVFLSVVGFYATWIVLGWIINF